MPHLTQYLMWERFRKHIRNELPEKKTTALFLKGDIPPYSRPPIEKSGKGVTKVGGKTIVNPGYFNYAGTDNGLVKMTASIPVSLPRMKAHLKVLNYYIRKTGEAWQLRKRGAVNRIFNERNVIDPNHFYCHDHPIVLLFGIYVVALETGRKYVIQAKATTSANYTKKHLQIRLLVFDLSTSEFQKKYLKYHLQNMFAVRNQSIFKLTIREKMCAPKACHFLDHMTFRFRINIFMYRLWEPSRCFNF
ncbi:hypothetical protein J3Q64DRAFT_1818152 [Phycomyces blakesleeanus]|uniref:Uncharacterized protein n=1 Tax=Phycomyces blakesleeanus TaxID=4837 RepID=A0ABR3BGJ2_PHYBL